MAGFPVPAPVSSFCVGGVPLPVKGETATAKSTSGLWKTADEDCGSDDTSQNEVQHAAPDTTHSSLNLLSTPVTS